MFCSYCGKEIQNNSTTCQFCGAVLPQAQQVPPQAPQQAPYQAPQQAPYQAPQQTPYQAPYQGQYNAPYTPPTPPKKKSKAPMIIGIIVGIIVVLGIIGAIAGSGDTSSDSGYAPVETFGDYDYNFESIPADAVQAADVHILTQTTAEGLTNTITYYCDGDDITSWTQVSTANVSGVDSDTIQQAVAGVEAKFAPYDFIDYSYSVDGDIMTETFVINDVPNNIDDLIELQLVDAGLLGAKRISWAQTKTNLLAQGYTEVE